MLSIGLLGATGYMGSALCSGLLEAFRKQQLGFVILHRPSSDTSKYPSDVEKRQLDLEGDDVPKTRQTLKGLQVVMYVAFLCLTSAVYSTAEPVKFRRVRQGLVIPVQTPRRSQGHA